MPTVVPLPAEAFFPVFFSLRFGGAWSYAAEGLRAVARLEMGGTGTAPGRPPLSHVQLRVRRGVRVRVDPAAFAVAHEMEHLEEREVSGRRLCEFRFV